AGLTLQRVSARQWQFVYPAVYGELGERFRKGVDLYEAGQLARAERILRATLAEMPDHLDALHSLARLKDDLGETSVATTICEEYPGDFMPEIRYGLALALFQLGDRQRAGRALRTALAHSALPAPHARFWHATAGALEWLRNLSGC